LNPKADVFAIGLFMYRLLTGPSNISQAASAPVAEGSQRSTSAGPLPDCPASESLRHLIQSCLHEDPEQRIGMSKVLYELDVLVSGYDCYIAYQRHDENLAAQLCAELEQSGKKCFIEKSCVWENRSEDCCNALLTSPAMTFVPLLTGSTLGEVKGTEWDIFLTYRVATDSELVSRLYLALSRTTVVDDGVERSLRVFWYQECVEAGEEWRRGCLNALCSSQLFVPVISNQAIQSISTLLEDSQCDNFILENDLAIELVSMGRLSKIIPLFVGEKVDSVYHDFEWSVMKNAPDTAVQSIRSTALECLASDELLSSLLPRGTLSEMVPGQPLSVRSGRTVRQTLETLTQFQGHLMRGPCEPAFDKALLYISRVAQSLIPEEVGGCLDPVLLQLQMAVNLRSSGRLKNIQPILSAQIAKSKFIEFQARNDQSPASFHQRKVFKATNDVCCKLIGQTVKSANASSVWDILRSFLEFKCLVLREHPQEDGQVESDLPIRAETAEGEDLATELIKIVTRNQRYAPHYPECVSHICHSRTLHQNGKPKERNSPCCG